MKYTRVAGLMLMLAQVACSGGNGNSDDTGDSGDGDSADGDGSNPWDDEPTGVDAGGTLTVDIDGVEAVGSVYNASYDNFGQFTVQSLSDEGDMIGFSIASELIGVGTFDCGNPDEASLRGNFESEGRFSDNTSGCVIEITEFGEVGEPIRGTFSGSVVGNAGSTNLTDGVIDVTRGSTL